MRQFAHGFGVFLSSGRVWKGVGRNRPEPAKNKTTFLPLLTELVLACAATDGGALDPDPQVPRVSDASRSTLEPTFESLARLRAITRTFEAVY